MSLINLNETYRDSQQMIVRTQIYTNQGRIPPKDVMCYQKGSTSLYACIANLVVIAALSANGSAMYCIVIP